VAGWGKVDARLHASRVPSAWRARPTLLLALFAAGIALGFGLAGLLLPAPGTRDMPAADPRDVGFDWTWLAFGFAAQIVFMARMLVQWFASERAGRSVVPRTFWWLSLAGGVMLLAYFLRRGDPVGVWGQLLGVAVYVRNLALIRRARAVAGTLPVAELPGFAAGLLSVQDVGAQWAAPLLDARDGMRVLDACAAPGGKTGHLLELADLDLLALDNDATRLRRVRENLDRLGLDASLRVADAGEPAAWWDGRAFDRILLDAPCTASGVARRHADGKWLKRAEDMQQLAKEQARLLDALWPLLKPGGTMLYATCSLFRAENQAPMTAFAGRHADARLDLPELPGARAGQLLPGPDTDGFFYARLHKT